MDRGDDDHEAARGWIENQTAELATTPLIVAELDHMVSLRGGPAAARALRQDLDRGAYLIEWWPTAIHEAIAVAERYESMEAARPRRRLARDPRGAPANHRDSDPRRTPLPRAETTVRRQDVHAIASRRVLKSRRPPAPAPRPTRAQPDPSPSPPNPSSAAPLPTRLGTAARTRCRRRTCARRRRLRRSARARAARCIRRSAARSRCCG